ncbi:MAG: DUF2752 domain-containing protein [Bacteroidia bacterium]
MKRKLRIIASIFFVVTPLPLMFLPVDFFDQGRSICISKLFINKDCPGCGITRAVQHSIHGEWSTAFNYNKLIVIVGPLLIYLWLIELRNLIKYFKKRN